MKLKILLIALLTLTLIGCTAAQRKDFQEAAFPGDTIAKVSHESYSVGGLWCTYDTYLNEDKGTYRTVGGCI